MVISARREVRLLKLPLSRVGCVSDPGVQKTCRTGIPEILVCTEMSAGVCV